MRHPTLAFLALVLASSFAAVGCANLDVTRINSDQAKPNNVWVFFTVERKEEPVAGLTADDFEIYEDGQLVSKFESKQTIQNPDVAAVMYTLLLLDMSGSITESGESESLVNAAQSFMKQMEDTPQKVGVYAFDGGEDIKSVVRFTEATGSIEGGLEGLRVYRAKDPSTNLNGAVMQGMEELDKELQADKRPLKFGTLVVFSDGTDRAGRVTEGAMLESLGKEEYRARAESADEDRTRWDRDGHRSRQGRRGVRTGRQTHRGAEQAVLPALVLHALTQWRSRGPHSGQREGRERPLEGHRFARLQLLGREVRSAPRVRSGARAEVPSRQGPATRRRRRAKQAGEGREAQ
jgi:hypothetical protein